MILQDYVNEIFARFEKANPFPKGELYYTNPFTLLTAVVLSAQATDKGVNKVTCELFNTIQKPEDLLALGEEGLKEKIKTIGLYQAKAKNLIKLAERLVEHFNGEVPQNLEDLISLAGVGRKTANVVLNIAFNQLTLAVDTHVFRVAHRLHLSEGTTPEKVEKDLLHLIPLDYLRHAHHWLILHGRYICKARNPLCQVCLLKDICPSFGKFS